jgi:hypothetical protein
VGEEAGVDVEGAFAVGGADGDGGEGGEHVSMKTGLVVSLLLKGGWAYWFDGLGLLRESSTGSSTGREYRGDLTGDGGGASARSKSPCAVRWFIAVEKCCRACFESEGGGGGGGGRGRIKMVGAIYDGRRDSGKSIGESALYRDLYTWPP